LRTYAFVLKRLIVLGRIKSGLEMIAKSISNKNTRSVQAITAKRKQDGTFGNSCTNVNHDTILKNLRKGSIEKVRQR